MPPSKCGLVFILSPRFKKPPKKKSRKGRSKILTIEILQLMELNSNFSWKSKLLCFLFYFSIFQDYNFKHCLHTLWFHLLHVCTHIIMDETTKFTSHIFHEPRVFVFEQTTFYNGKGFIWHMIVTIVMPLHSHNFYHLSKTMMVYKFGNYDLIV